MVNLCQLHWLMEVFQDIRIYSFGTPYQMGIVII